MDQLLHWAATAIPQFSNLQFVLQHCVTSWTLKADIWRYLVLWLYGGIYADFDTAPNEFNATTINDDNDAFFVVEQYHMLSQYFMAVSPRHPLMFYAIQRSIFNLMQSPDTLQIDAAYKTGPHALHKAFQDFQRDAGILVDSNNNKYKKATIQAGTYVGSYNRTVRVVGTARNENQYVHRLALKPSERLKGYQQMGMVHFSSYSDFRSKRSGIS
eukprot:CAMPEP_0119548406 /NCGR_PEP_ID=MMETSP1352-20130426/2341_1 /TAXON_ID=265584 /ORGANISM="Stauroneis constricta, Strain CCMP1120" /LENGTH=213 /DNA_ID=CAMNT_0007593669 /DNA_START=589 /DNA_END=1226 /DNA_ORIENTATION=+